MRKKIIGYMLLLAITLQLSGCMAKEATVVAPEASEGVEAIAPVGSEAPVSSAAPVETATSFDYAAFTGEDFKGFFRQYFSLTEEEILRFNQNPTLMTEDCLKLNETCGQKLTNMLTLYLSEGAKAHLKEGYYREYFDLPKKLEINEYVTYDAATVEDVAVVGVKSLGKNRVYEVAVTTKNKVKSITEANNDYVWDREKQYYMSLGASNKPLLAFSSAAFIGTRLDESYAYQEPQVGGGLDEIKLVQKYWVEVACEDMLKVESVKEAMPYQTTKETRQKASNTKFVERIPYTSEVSESQKAKVIETLYPFITQSKPFYTHYEKAFKTGYNTFYSVLKTELEVSENVVVSKERYKSAFGLSLIPYKDHMMAVQVEKGAITVTPSVYGTKAQPRFKVVVPAKVVYSTDEQANYNYEYFVGMEKEKIEFIQCLGVTPVVEEEKNKS